MQNNITADFYENNDHALRPTIIVLRDSLGLLAVAKLQASFDLSKMDTDEMLDRLHDIINDLHDHYENHRIHYSD